MPTLFVTPINHCHNLLFPHYLIHLSHLLSPQLALSLSAKLHHPYQLHTFPFLAITTRTLVLMPNKPISSHPTLYWLIKINIQWSLILAQILLNPKPSRPLYLDIQLSNLILFPKLLSIHVGKM